MVLPMVSKVHFPDQESLLQAVVESLAAWVVTRNLSLVLIGACLVPRVGALALPGTSDSVFGTFGLSWVVREAQFLRARTNLPSGYLHYILCMMCDYERGTSLLLFAEREKFASGHGKTAQAFNV